MIRWFVFFFFQAEDGIRDRNVTGVQTCALPICRRRLARHPEDDAGGAQGKRAAPAEAPQADRTLSLQVRSEERRVGKEGRARGAREQGKEKNGVKSSVRWNSM